MFKPIVYRPPSVVTKRSDEEAIFEALEVSVQKQTVIEKRRKEIEDEVEKKLEESKQKAAERCLKTFEYFRLNEDLLENMLRYPMIAHDLKVGNCTGNFFDETEFKLAG